MCNVAVILLALVVFWGNYTILVTCAIAYSYGLRHAFDIDHIAAIDNMTRKFIAEKKNPNFLGLNFSLGHSSIVLLSSFFLALSGLTLKDEIFRFKDIGGKIGTFVSAVVLLGLGVVNLMTLRQTVRTYQAHKIGSPPDEKSISAGMGWFSRVIRRLFDKVDTSYKMYMVGFLFGLGFDTATEVGVLGIAFTGAHHDISIWAIMIFPLLFTVGMTLADAADNLLMVKIYSWGAQGTLRRMRYSICLLGISVALAFGIGAVQAMSFLSDLVGEGVFADTVETVADIVAPLGIAVVVLFVVVWAFFRRKNTKRL